MWRLAPTANQDASCFYSCNRKGQMEQGPLNANQASCLEASTCTRMAQQHHHNLSYFCMRACCPFFKRDKAGQTLLQSKGPPRPRSSNPQGCSFGTRQTPANCCAPATGCLQQDHQWPTCTLNSETLKCPLCTCLLYTSPSPRD